jgi:hypothetical protein
MKSYQYLLAFVGAAAGAGFLRRRFEEADEYKVTGRFVDGKEVDEETYYASFAADVEAVSKTWKEAQAKVRAERGGRPLDMTTEEDYNAVMDIYNKLRNSVK